jgi:creatinine amidohydrolase
MDEFRLAYLRPGQIRRRLAEASVVLVPVGPLEWHGPHMPYGTDGINATRTAEEVCRRVGGVVWPTVFFGTERERRPEQLESLGFRRDQYVVGMDFPANSLPSSYCPEEVLAVLVREVLREIRAIGASLAVLVNGHGAENQIATLSRLAVEITHTTGPRVYYRMASPRSAEVGSGGHADDGETSLMLHLTESVDLSALPPLPQRLRYADFAIVDGGGFDGKTPDHTMPDKYDPRRQATAPRGAAILQQTADEIAAEVQAMLREG